MSVLRRAPGTPVEHGDALLGALIDLGLKVRKVDEASVELTREQIVWLQGSANWFPSAARRLAGLPPDRRPLVVLWHTESLPAPKLAGLPTQRRHARELAKIALRDLRAADPQTNFRRLRKLLAAGLPDLLVVPARYKQEFLAEHGISSAFVPVGYHPSEHGADRGLERDLDVLFLGQLTVPRRKKLLRRLRREGIRVEAAGDWHDPTLWGESRTRLLNRTRIFLNLFRYPWQRSDHRLLAGMATGTLVISEPIYRPEPFVPGTHYVSARADELSSVVQHYLENEDQRARIAEQGRRFVTEDLRMTQSASEVLARITDQIGQRVG